MTTLEDIDGALRRAQQQASAIRDARAYADSAIICLGHSPNVLPDDLAEKGAAFINALRRAERDADVNTEELARQGHDL